MAKILFPTQPSRFVQRPFLYYPPRNYPHVSSREEFTRPQHAVGAETELVNRITTQLDRALSLILHSKDDVQQQQQQLILLLMDLLQQQPDEILIEVMANVLNKHGIHTYRFSSGGHCYSSEMNHGHCQSLPLKQAPNGSPTAFSRKQCLVRLGPIVLELWNDGDYCDLLRGARDLCWLKHNHHRTTRNHDTTKTEAV